MARNEEGSKLTPPKSPKKNSHDESRTRKKNTTFSGQFEGQSGNQTPISASNALGSFCSVKLNHENYLSWKSMVFLV